MTGTLDRLIEEFLRGLIIAEVHSHIQVVTSLMGESEAAATLPRIVIQCQSQETPEFFEVGVHRIVTQIFSVAEATSPVSSDDMEEMNRAVDRVIVFADSLPTYLSSQDVVTHGVVYGEAAQQIQENKLIRIRSAEIWSRLITASPLTTQIPTPVVLNADKYVTVSPADQFGVSNINIDGGSGSVFSLNWITTAATASMTWRPKGAGGSFALYSFNTLGGIVIGDNALFFRLGSTFYITTAQGLSLVDDATAIDQHATLQLLAGADIPAAATTDLGAATGRVISITGSGGPITALGTTSAGAVRKCRFTGTPTLTYNVTSLILPGNANIVVAVGDCAEFISLGSGNWYCSNYQRQATAP